MKPVSDPNQDNTSGTLEANERGAATTAVGSVEAAKEEGRQSHWPEGINYLKHSPQGIFLTDERGRYLCVNPAACKLTGYTEAELLERSIPDLVAEECLEAGRQHFAKVKKEGRACAEFCMLQKGGHRRWWSVEAIKVSEQQLLGFCTDITERHLAEQGLKEAEWKFRALFEQGPIGVAYHRMIYDEAGKPVDYLFLDANESYRELTGVDPRGKRVTEAFPGIEKDPFDWIGTFGAVAKTGKSLRFEQYLETNGRWYDCVGYQYRPDHFVAAFMEITKRKLAEQEMARSEAALKRQNGLFTSLLSILPLGVFMVEAPLGRPLLANTAALRLLGRGIDPEASVENLSEVYRAFKNSTGEPYPSEEMPILRGLQGETSYIDDMAIQRPDGSRVQLEVFGSPVRDEQGRIWASMVTFSDITERRKAQEEKERLEAQFQQSQKMEAVGRLAGGVAHDFNNMLAGTLLQLNLLEDNPSLDPEARKAVRDLIAETRRAAGLTRQLLMFSRQAVLQVRHQSLNTVVENMLKMLTRVIGENYRLQFAPGSELPMVNVDTGMLEQVLLNLAVNARDAMPRGGEILLKTGHRIFDEHTCKEHPRRHKGGYVWVSVQDEGTGIDPAILGKIFDPFFTTKEAGKGTGLGLSTVDGILNQHFGWVEVESELGRGSCFTLYLPAVYHPVLCTEGTQPKEPGRREGKETLLLVEDEAVVRLITRKNLDRLGYTILEAEDPRKALEIWRTKQGCIDLVITDMVMPGSLSGLELIQHLRGAEPGLPVILMSGYSEVLARLKESELRQVEFLQKPFSAAELTQAIRRALMTRGQDRAKGG